MQTLSQASSAGIVARASMAKGVAVAAGRRVFVAVQALVALVLISVGVASSLARPAVPGGLASPVRGRDQFFAGWSYQEAGRAAVSTEFVVPKLTCTSTNTGVAAGAFLYTASDPPGQQGSGRTLVSAASVQLFCLGGEPSLLAALEVKGRQTYGPIKPHVGDRMLAVIIDSASGLGVTLQDLTEHHRFTVGRGTSPARATAAAIGDVPLRGVGSLTPGPLYPITNFGSIRFGGRVNGGLLGAAGGTGFSMVSNKVLLIRTGALKGRGPQRNRSAFDTTWKHS